MDQKKHQVPRLLVGLLICAILAVTPAFAQEPTADEINAVAKKLSCPTCTGINVADCPTETCAQWRAKIGEMLGQGHSEQEILDYFAARYGDHVLQVPPRRGFFLLVWALPILAILIGFAWLVYLMRGWSRRRAVATAASAQIVDTASVPPAAEGAGAGGEDEYLRRVQEDLERLS